MWKIGKVFEVVDCCFCFTLKKFVLCVLPHLAEEAALLLSLLQL
jgi:hypothetical protein